MVLLGALISERLGSIEGANVPDKCFGWVVVQVSQVVSERAAVERVARHPDLRADGKGLVHGLVTRLVTRPERPRGS